MFPDSEMKRKKQQKTEGDKSLWKLRKYEHTDTMLDSKQHEEMCNVVTAIEANCSDKLQDLIVEGINFRY